jgi:hypothetical protein
MDWITCFFAVEIHISESPSTLPLWVQIHCHRARGVRVSSSCLQRACCFVQGFPPVRADLYEACDASRDCLPVKWFHHIKQQLLQTVTVEQQGKVFPLHTL